MMKLRGRCGLPEIPTGYIGAWMDSGALLVLPVPVYLAALRLGKRLRRQATMKARLVKKRYQDMASREKTN